ncbi:MAG: hypothetical protein ACLR1D_05305 [Dialister sp.]
MNIGNCLSATLVSLLLIGSLGLTGCGMCGVPKKESQIQQPYGVADLETLVKSHPKYSEYFKQETEYNHLLIQYKNEQKRLIEASSRQASIRESVEDQNLRLTAENELKLRIREKEEELNKKLADLYTEIEAKHHGSTGNCNLESLTPEERAHMANLQMKLTVLGVTGEEKDKVKKELHEFLNARSFPSFAMKGWSEAEIKVMTAAKEKGKAELEAYAEAQGGRNQNTFRKRKTRSGTEQRKKSDLPGG